MALHWAVIAIIQIAVGASLSKYQQNRAERQQKRALQRSNQKLIEVRPTGSGQDILLPYGRTAVPLRYCYVSTSDHTPYFPKGANAFGRCEYWNDQGAYYSDNGARSAYLHAQFVIGAGPINSVKKVLIDEKEFDSSGDDLYNHIAFAWQNGGTASDIATRFDSGYQGVSGNNNGKRTASAKFTNLALADIIAYSHKTERKFGEFVPEPLPFIEGKLVRKITRSGNNYTLNSTMEYSTLSPYVLLDLLVDPNYGLGYSADNIDLKSFHDAAEMADEVMQGQGSVLTGNRPNDAQGNSQGTWMSYFDGLNLAGNTAGIPVPGGNIIIPGWSNSAQGSNAENPYLIGNNPNDFPIRRWESCGNLISSTALADNLREVKNTMPGVELYINHEGKFKLAIPPKADKDTDPAPTPVMTLTDVDYVSPPELSYPGTDLRINKLNVSFINSNKNAASDSVVFPSANSTLKTQLLAEDGDADLQGNLTLGMTDNKWAAADIATKEILQSRRADLVLHLDTSGMLLEVGDILRVSSQALALSPTLFRMDLDPELQPNGAVRVHCKEYLQSDWAWNSSDQEMLVLSTRPDLTVNPPTNVTVNYTATQGEIATSWTAPTTLRQNVVGYEVQYREGSDPYVPHSTTDDLTTQVRQVVRDGTTSYTFRVRSLGARGTTSAWVESSAVSTTRRQGEKGDKGDPGAAGATGVEWTLYQKLTTEGASSVTAPALPTSVRYNFTTQTFSNLGSWVSDFPSYDAATEIVYCTRVHFAGSGTNYLIPNENFSAVQVCDPNTFLDFIFMESTTVPTKPADSRVRVPTGWHATKEAAEAAVTGENQTYRILQARNGVDGIWKREDPVPVYGEAGTDGRYKEFIYRKSAKTYGAMTVSERNLFNPPTTSEANMKVDDYVPPSKANPPSFVDANYTDDPTDVTDNRPFLYRWLRTFSRMNEQWGEFITPPSLDTSRLAGFTGFVTPAIAIFKGSVGSRRYNPYFIRERGTWTTRSDDNTVGEVLLQMDVDIDVHTSIPSGETEYTGFPSYVESSEQTGNNDSARTGPDYTNLNLKEDTSVTVQRTNPNTANFRGIRVRKGTTGNFTRLPIWGGNSVQTITTSPFSADDPLVVNARSFTDDPRCIQATYRGLELCFLAEAIETGVADPDAGPRLPDPVLPSLIVDENIRINAPTQVDGAGFWQWRLSTNNADFTDSSNISSFTGTQTLVTGAVNGTTYYYGVRYIPVAGNTDWSVSRWTTGTYRYIITKLGIPDLVVTAGNASALVSAPDTVAGQTSWSYRYRVGTGTWTTVANQPNGNGDVIVSGLTNGTTYEFQTRRDSSTDEPLHLASDWTEGVMATPLATITNLAAPGAPTLAVVDAGAALTATFPATIAGQTGWTVEWKKTSDTDWVSRRVETGASTTFSGLDVLTSYDVRLRRLPTNDLTHRVSPYGASASATTLKIRVSGDFSFSTVRVATATTGGQVRISGAVRFQRISSDRRTITYPDTTNWVRSLGVDVRWRVHGTTAWTQRRILKNQISYSQSTGSFTLTDPLLADTNYDFQVRNYADDGTYTVSTWTDIYILKKEAPVVAAAPAVTARTTTNAGRSQLRVTGPAGVNGALQFKIEAVASSGTYTAGPYNPGTRNVNVNNDIVESYTVRVARVANSDSTTLVDGPFSPASDPVNNFVRLGNPIAPTLEIRTGTDTTINISAQGGDGAFGRGNTFKHRYSTNETGPWTELANGVSSFVAPSTGTLYYVQTQSVAQAANYTGSGQWGPSSSITTHGKAATPAAASARWESSGLAFIVSQPPFGISNLPWSLRWRLGSAGNWTIVSATPQRGSGRVPTSLRVSTTRSPIQVQVRIDSGRGITTSDWGPTTTLTSLSSSSSWTGVRSGSQITVTAPPTVTGQTHWRVRYRREAAVGSPPLSYTTSAYIPIATTTYSFSATVTSSAYDVGVQRAAPNTATLRDSSWNQKRLGPTS